MHGQHDRWITQLAAQIQHGDPDDVRERIGVLVPGSFQGLIDEYLLAVSPIVLSSGKRVFDDVRQDLPLRLTHSKAFDAGAVVLRYEPTV